MTDLTGRLIALGGSVGALDALATFFGSVSPHTGHTFVVIEQLPGNGESRTLQVLARQTTMRVQHVQDGMQLRANEVFLAPAHSDVGVVGGRFRVHLRPPSERSLAIDYFFRSAAAALGSSLTGIVLSGDGSDGSNGLLAVHKAGGRCLTQAPDTAACDEMPSSAISTRVVEQILTPEALAVAVDPLADCGVRQAGNLHLLNRIRRLTGHDFRQHRQGALSRRLERRSAAAGHSSPSEYVTAALEDPQEVRAIARDFLDGTTSFFRDADVFKALDSGILAEALSSTGAEKVNIWSVGCSTGEEAYSLAMLCEEHRQRSGGAPARIFATDCDPNAIEIAQRASYSADLVKSLPEALRRKYLKPEGNQFVVDASIRQNVFFSVHDALSDPPLTDISVAICRNVLGHLNQEAQARLLSCIHLSFGGQGLLLLGRSETANAAQQLFKATGHGIRLYRMLPGAGSLGADKDQLRPRPTQNDAGTSLQQSEKAADRQVPIFTDNAAALVDESNKVIQVFGDISPYLELGAAELQFGTSPPDDPAGALSAALGRAQRNGSTVSYDRLELTIPGSFTQVKISVRPLASREHTLVLFQNASAAKDKDFQNSGHHDRILEQQTEHSRAQDTGELPNEKLGPPPREQQATQSELSTANQWRQTPKGRPPTTPMMSAEDEGTEVPRTLGQARRLTQTQKMDAVGNLAGGVAHELNNLLAAIVGVVGAWEGKADTTAELQRDLSAVLSACARGKDLTSNLLGISRRASVICDDVPLQSVVQEVFTHLKGRTEPGVKFTLSLPQEPIIVSGDRSQIAQALVNLCLNAFEAVGVNGTVNVGLSKGVASSSQRGEELPQSGTRRTATNPTTAVLSVTDDGHGMDGDTLSQAFDPYFTTKTRATGTGLGLTTVFGVARAHGGWVGVKSIPARGSEFTLHLPTVSAFEPDAQKSSGVRNVILLLDDDALARHGMVRLMSSYGLHVLPFADGQQALETIRDLNQRIDLAVVDLVMPKTNGFELLERLREVRPKLPVVLYSGFADVATDKRLERDAMTEFVTKPVDPASFRTLLENLIRSGSEQSEAV